VIVPRSNDGGWILHPRPNLENEPDLSDRVLYAIDRDGENATLFDRYPDRAIFRLSFVIYDNPFVPEREVASLERRDLQEARFTWRITNDVGAPVVNLYLSDGKGGLVHYLLDDHSTLGATYRGTWTVAPNGAVSLDTTSAQLITYRMNGLPPSGTFAVGTGFGSSVDLLQCELMEWRYWFRGGATIQMVTPGAPWDRSPAPKIRWLPWNRGERMVVEPVT
jgi:hypothetical protein